MNKIITQGLVIIVLFFSIWFALREIDWMSLLKVEQATEKTEEKLGELFWELIKSSEREINNQSVVNSIDSIVTKICNKNEIDRSIIKVHIVNKDEVNAFALPNGHLVVYSGLILASDNQEELAGVICHEIAHIELNHVMKKLVKEVGLSVLISMTTGNAGSEIIKETAKVLSSSAFDRGLEKEADIKATDYLVEASINPEQFANFLYRLGDSENQVMKYLSWISTHPDSKERAEYIIEYSKDKVIIAEPILTPETWSELQNNLSELE